MPAKILLLLAVIAFTGIAFLLSFFVDLHIGTVIAFMLVPCVLGNTLEQVLINKRLNMTAQALVILIKETEGKN